MYIVENKCSRQVDKENLPATYPTSPQNSFNIRADTAPYFDMNVEDFSQDESNESSAEVEIDSHNNIADSSIENIQKLVSDRREKGAALRSASSSHGVCWHHFTSHCHGVCHHFTFNFHGIRL